MPPRKFGLALFPSSCHVSGAVRSTADGWAAGGLQQPSLFPGRSRPCAGILAGSQTWNTLQDWGTDGSPLVPGFQRLHQVPHRARTEFYVAVAGGNAEVLLSSLHRIFSPGFCREPATVAEDRSRQGHRRRIEIRSHQVRPGLFRSLTLENAGAERRRHLRWYLSFHRRVSSTFSAAPATATRLPGPTTSMASTMVIQSGPKGMASMTMTAPNAITRFQDAYVEKVIDTLNDLPNVLWAISEEAPRYFRVVEQLPDRSHPRAYEAQKPHQHPIG